MTDKLEKKMAEKIFKKIEEDNRSETKILYEQYLYYTRNILEDFDEDLQNEVMFKYGKYHIKKGLN